MSDEALRTWGLAASAAVIAAALTVAALGSCGDGAREAPQPPPAESDAGPTMAPPDPVAEPAAAEAPPPAQPMRPAFIIRFEDPHPMARAQQIAAAGRIAEARRTAIATLNGQRALRGLCFERFTLGGAETVLSACAPVADAQAFQARWTERLSAMPGVAYAEANAIAQPEMRSPRD